MDPRVSLAVLTRLAARKPATRTFLHQALDRRRLSKLADTAVDVAVETGDPLGRLNSSSRRA